MSEPVSKTFAPAEMPAERVGEFYDRLAKVLPGRAEHVGPVNPKRRPDPFRSCISCMLSAQSLDRNTEAASRALFRLARTPKGILRLDDAAIAAAIRPAGLYNMKTRNIRKFCTALIGDHGGVVPETREGLMSLPGIGRKCADIVLTFTFGADVIAVDTHVHRVCNRTGLALGATEAKTAESLEARTPARAMHDGHVWLLNFGKRVCTSRAPKCASCPVEDLCLWPDKGSRGAAGASGDAGAGPGPSAVPPSEARRRKKAASRKAAPKKAPPKGNAASKRRAALPG